MTLTVFTPVYNRRELLLDLYQSLEEQSCKEFIWSIVDDGSTDGTKETVESISQNASFKIMYTYQNNQGKHVAHNTGVDMCETDLFVCVDSDDKLTEDAVETVLKVADEHKNENLLGFFFRKVDTLGNVSGGSFIIDPLIGIRDLYHTFGFNGELVIVLYTHFAKKSRFPKFENEKFVSELVYYNELNSLAPMLWTDKAIYIYEYQESGYSKNANKLIVNNPYGAACGYLSEAHYASKLFSRIKNYAEYNSISQIFNLDKSKLPEFKIGIIEKIGGFFLQIHYCILFNSMKEMRN